MIRRRRPMLLRFSGERVKPQPIAWTTNRKIGMASKRTRPPPAVRKANMSRSAPKACAYQPTTPRPIAGGGNPRGRLVRMPGSPAPGGAGGGRLGGPEHLGRGDVLPEGVADVEHGHLAARREPAHP